MTAEIGTHADRPVRVDERAGRRVVAKRYLATDGRRIFDEHRRLWESSIGRERPIPGIPEPLGWDSERAEVTMEEVPGAPLGARGRLGQTVAYAPHAAGLLADLHRSPVRLKRVRDGWGVVRSLRRKSDDFAGTLDGRRFARAVSLLDDDTVLTRVARDEVLVPSHGDWSPRNVLVDGSTVRMIDLDRVQMAGGAHDVGYWGAWCWATQLLAGVGADWSLCAGFMAEYVARRPDAHGELSATLWFHRAAALLRIAHGWSALERDVDARRAIIDEAAWWATQA